MQNLGTPENGQADASDQIEITPEMIEAGAGVLGFFDRDQHDRGDTAKEVFAAMMAARCATSRSRL